MLTEQQAESACLEFLNGCEVPQANAVMASAPSGVTTPRRLVEDLRAAGVDWKTILFKALPMILMLIPGGAAYATILEQLLALFGPKAA